MIDLLGSKGLEIRTAIIALDVVLKATALMALAFACHGLLGRRRAPARSALWNACLVGLLLLPAAGSAFPRIRVTIPSSRTAAESPIPAPPAAIAPSEMIPSGSPAAFEREPGPPFGKHDFARTAVVQPLRSPPREPRFRIGGLEIVIGVYLAVAGLLFVRLAASLAAVVRLRRQCPPVADAPWSEAAERWRSRLGIARRVPILTSDRITVPVVVGWLHPAILLPKTLAGAANPALVDAVLLHELAHVRRGDFGWNLVRRIVQLLYWPHPMVWLAGRIVGSVREQACDDLCVHELGGAEVYRSSLIEVASGLVRRPGPALGMAMARSTKLGRRLAWIERSRGASRCLSHWPTRLVLGAVAATLSGVLGSVELARTPAKATEPPRGAEKPRPEAGQQQPEAVEVVVLAKDSGKPLEGATVRTSIDLTDLVIKADREGRVRIDLSTRTFRDSLSFDVWAEGYVQQRHYFAQNDARYPRIPDRIVVDLHPGEQTLGGTVTDEQGRPIAGVRVKIDGRLGKKKQKEERASMVDATTDDRGRWRCRCFREMEYAWLYLSHPDYLADGAFHARRHGLPIPGAVPEPDDKPLEGLRDFSDVQVMRRGVAISGEVRDSQARPVVGAEVGWLEAGWIEHIFRHQLARTTTDGEGRFHFPHARPGSLVLQVMAKGHAPELKHVQADEKTEPVSFTLRPGRTLSGRVADSRGRPIPDAFVGVDTWRRSRALGVHLKSDADGRFRWEDAPSDPVLINASHAGYETVVRLSVVPGEEMVVTLKGGLSISGRIRDAKTHKPIDRVDVEFGTPDLKSGGFTWARNSRVFAYQGTLQAEIDIERTRGFRLRFRSVGYEPRESRTFRGDERRVEYDVELSPWDETRSAIEGTVRRPDGAPLAGAEVAIAYPRASRGQRLPLVQVENGRFQPAPYNPFNTTKTDAMGRFRLGRVPDPEGRYFAVVVVHPEFCAEVNRPAFEADPTIVARPWGRVEGVARLGSKPAAGASIRYYADRMGNSDVPSISERGDTKADAEGRFFLDRILPGDLRVSLSDGEGTSARWWSNGTLLQVGSGETVRAAIGGTGRPVVARIERPAEFDPAGDYAANSQFDLVSDRPMHPYSIFRANARDGSVIELGKRWWASDEGHAYRRGLFRFGRAKLQSDGTLRVDDVPPGEYRLSLIYSAVPYRGRDVAPDRTAFATKQFTIPEVPGGRSDVPFDLGVLRPKPWRELDEGRPVPPFEVETLDGRRVKFEDFRGKRLLLTFWATWSGTCLDDIAGLKAIHDRFGKDGRLAMLGLSLDDAREAPRKLVVEKGMPWTHGFLGRDVQGGVQDAYLVRAIPAYFLIGPDGLLKAQSESVSAIENALARALERP